MARANVFKVTQLLSRTARHSSQRSLISARQSIAAHPRVSSLSHSLNGTSISSPRLLSTTSKTLKGMSPESENPQPKESENAAATTTPTEISMEEYHHFSDQYMNNILSKLEQLQEAREDVDVEFSVCAIILFSIQPSYCTQHHYCHHPLPSLLPLPLPINHKTQTR
jgi:frataxin